MPGQMRNEFKPSLQIGWIVKILFKERGAKVTVNASTSVSTLSATSPQHAPAPQPTSTAAADQVVLERHATTVKCVNIFEPLATSLQISKNFWFTLGSPQLSLFIPRQIQQRIKTLRLCRG
jgi:hypothetical protein